jgi:hypothetical protein
MGASISYGKRGDALAYSGGSMTLQLDNTDSAYTPDAGGTYSDARFLGVEVKLYADVTGAGAPTWTHGPPAAFSGYVTDISYTFADSYDATVNVTVSDALTLLGTLAFDGGAFGFTLGAGGSPPTKVGTVTATPGNTEVALSWSAPFSTLPITDYVVQYSTDDATWSTFAHGSDATTATVTGLSNGTLYYFRVAAVNSEGTGPFSDSVTATPAPQVPDQVGTVTTTPDAASVPLSWSAPADGGSPITDYSVQYSTDDATWSTFAHGSTATTTTVTGLSNGTLYYFRVAAVNAAGTGTYSASATATPFSVLGLSPLVWIDASDTSTITESGGAVSQIDDKSGNAYHLTQADALRQPLTGVSTINGRNVLHYGGISGGQRDWLTNTSAPVASTSYTMFAVYYVKDARFATFSTGNILGVAYRGREANSNTTLSLAMSATSLYVDAVQFTGTTQGDVHDAVNVGSPNIVRLTFTSTTYDGVSFGYPADVQRAFKDQTLVAEAFFVASPTASEIADAEAYLAEKYGITI